MTGGGVYYAGILVRADDSAWDDVLRALREIPEVGVHQQERETGRIVVTVATDALDGQTSVLGDIRVIDGVLLAEPVYAFRDSEDGIAGEGAPSAEPNPHPFRTDE